MKFLSYIQNRLVLKLFLSYLIVIISGMIVLAVSAELIIPAAFDRHMGSMMDGNGMMGGMGMMTGDSMGDQLYNSFRSAAAETLFQAGLTAFILALAVSIVISRRVISPIQELTKASQFIAEGHYEQRVDLPGLDNPGRRDELAQLATSFNQMAEKLDQTEAMRRQLIGDVSHELRTPLTTIKGSMEGLLDGVLSPSPETFENIYRETSRLQRLVADLQELSQVESGAATIELVPTDLKPLIESVAGRLELQFMEKGVSLTISVAEALASVQADEDRLSQVLINLLGNALQYTPRDGRVSLSARQVGSQVQISVTDTGIGIPAEHLQHVFTRFYRVDKSRSRAGGGSGIGLTIAKHIIEKHGGRIWAESEGPDKGSTFTVSLPVHNK